MKAAALIGMIFRSIGHSLAKRHLKRCRSQLDGESPERFLALVARIGALDKVEQPKVRGSPH
jgi:hypothetical protein